MNRVILRETLISFIMAGQYLYFAQRFLTHFMETGRVSTLLYLLLESLLVVLYLTRRFPKDVSFIPRDWIYATLGTWLSLLYLPSGADENWWLTGIQAAGTLIALTGVASLGRSFGIVPANRGVKTGGLYRLVRHPIYFGYLLTGLSLTAQNPVAWNAGVLLCGTLCQVLRILREEALLSRDEAYRALMQRTRWRLLPGVW